MRNVSQTSSNTPFLDPGPDGALRGKGVRSCCDGSSDRSLMVDPLILFLVPACPPLPVEDKSCGMSYPVCGMMHIKRTLAANRKEQSMLRQRVSSLS